MDYKLVKRLGDAGFPLRKNVFANKDTLEPEFVQPTLSELIAECGRGVILWEEYENESTVTSSNDLLLSGNEKPRIWWAAKIQRLSHTVEPWIELLDFCRQKGSTPEEAVARLYLALTEPS